MIIKKMDNYIKVEIDENKIFLDPPKIYEGINILTDLKRKINFDKVFNLPGEYEVNNLFLLGYKNKQDSLVFLFYNNFIKCLYFNNSISDDVLKNIKEEFGNVDVVICNGIENYDKIKSELKPKVFITTKEEKIKAQKTKEIKINIKKIEEQNYILI